MERARFRRYSAIGQVLIWGFFFTVLVGSDGPYMGLTDAAWYAFAIVAGQAGLVYSHYFLVLPLFHQGKKWLYFSLLIPLVFVFTLLGYGFDLILPYGEDYVVDELETYWEHILYIFPISFLAIGLSSLYYFVEAWFRNIKRESFLKSEKLQAELNFLKSQINPHFLFNTLNNIYSYVQTGNEKSAPMLERLSSALRFMVYDCGEDKVELVKELQAVEDLLEIYKMKNSGQENIELIIEGVKSYHLIAPLIIVNLVENACKHSDAISNAKGFIRVLVKVDEHDECLCEIANSVRAGNKNKAPYGGIGLNNVVQRLDLQYEDLYTLDKQEEEGTYKVTLKMPLERKI